MCAGDHECDGHDKAFARWTGFWPGEAEAALLGIDLNELCIRGYDAQLSIKPTIGVREVRGGARTVRTFTMYRRSVPTDTHDENQRNAPDEPQFEGVVWTDGTCTIRWLTEKPATAVWTSLDDMLAVHGHPEYGSELVWHDEDDSR